MNDGYPTLRLCIEFENDEVPWTYPIALNGRTVAGVYIDGVEYVPQNACTVVQSFLNDFMSATECWYEHELSCGHTHYSGEKEPPRFCSECGAKVMKGDE